MQTFREFVAERIQLYVPASPIAWDHIALCEAHMDYVDQVLVPATRKFSPEKQWQIEMCRKWGYTKTLRLLLESE